MELKPMTRRVDAPTRSFVSRRPPSEDDSRGEPHPETQPEPQFRSATSPALRTLFLYLNAISCVAMGCLVFAAMFEIDPGRNALLNSMVYGFIFATACVVVTYVWLEWKAYVGDNLILERVLGWLNVVLGLFLWLMAALPVIAAVIMDKRDFKGIWLVGALAAFGSYAVFCGRLRVRRPVKLSERELRRLEISRSKPKRRRR